MSRPEIVTKLGTPVNLSCESPAGQPVSLCLWEWTVNEQRRVVYMDEAVARHNGGQTSVEGIRYTGGLKAGSCELRIDSVTVEHLGRWTCTLVLENNEICSGEVTVKKGESTWTGCWELYARTCVIDTVLNSCDLNNSFFWPQRHKLRSAFTSQGGTEA